MQRVRRSSIEGESEFNFTHALTRDVAYSQIRRPDRAHKHEAAAQWIQGLSGERDDKAELLADHYHHALTLRDQLGEETGPIAEVARVALRDAGERALRLSAPASASRLLAAAAELWSPGDQGYPRLLLSYGRALMRSEERGQDVVTRAHELLLAQGDREGAADALVFSPATKPATASPTRRMRTHRKRLDSLRTRRRPNRSSTPSRRLVSD